MKRALLIFCISLGVVSCDTPTASAPVVVAPQGPAAIKVDAAQEQQIADLKKAKADTLEAAQMASGEVYGVTVANTHNPDGPPKETVAAFASAASASLPPATEAQKALKDAQTLRALAGQLEAVKTELAGAKAQAEAEAKARAEADAKIEAQDAAMVKLKADAAAEQEKNRKTTQAAFDAKQKEIDAQRKIAADAVDEANSKQKAIVTWIFFGGAALCAIGAAVVGTLGVSIPMFGPRAAIGFGIASGLLFGLGMLFRFVERMIDQHPYVFYGGILAVLLVIAAAVAMIYSNHLHSKPEPITTP